jgi:ribose 5-phosphate isomerase B
MKIYLASDHAGFELKVALKIMLVEEGHEVEDFGAHQYEPEDDYPDTVTKVATAVASDPESRGIVLGGSGQGEAMACNRIKGARAAVYYGGPNEILRVSREHNNANILSLGARFMTEKEAKSAVTEWLSTPFSNEERHVRRLAKF